ncbi:MAG: GTPase HflX [Actinobacteria bacterium]|nr:GTPase HflX [Actinomycetota bacterium]MBM3712618.1 GTPase HflX [Actinomycetota bacterium]
MASKSNTFDNISDKERAFLIFIKLKNKSEFKNSILKHSSSSALRHADLDEEIEELKNLSLSAGAEVAGILCHNQSEINPKYFISAGKLEEIKNIIDAKKVDLVIYDNDLTPAQQSNLEDKLNLKVIDRTALILDIFAQRAQSSEGKMQVELAQLNYLLPRLRGKGIELSRLGGGIGTRGPGEQKLEVDRRKIRKRIKQLEERIEQISVQREIQRKRREENSLFLISLIGYTNSGKSTLLNTLTSSNVLVKDMLFSTLDSTTRKIKIPEMDEILITDTVGFIEKLPHQLVAAFKSTLEEVRKADLLLMMVDISNKNFDNHIKSVMRVLKEIEVLNKPIIIVFNKIDRLKSGELNAAKLKYRNAIFISALKKAGLEELYKKIRKVIDRNYLKVTVKIPYIENKLISYIFDNCKVLDKKYTEEGAVLLISANLKMCNQLSSFVYKDLDTERKFKRSRKPAVSGNEYNNDSESFDGPSLKTRIGRIG